jgi:NTP pyrophosphatase (non-canonical NTP hydrolase)
MAELSFGGRVAEWAEDRNLIQGSTPRKQMTKLFEECEELSHALQDDDLGEIIDAIGDIQVVLAVMCAQLGLSIDKCREVAWNEIKDRKGKMVDGVFVKDKQDGQA